MGRPARIAVAALVMALTGAGSAQAGSGRFDYGDAPDRRDAGYILSPGVVAQFPTNAASAGPRHRSSRLRLGVAHTLETGPLMTNRDRSDDGALALSTLRRCRVSLVYILIDATRLSERQRRSRNAVVNGWFDWNRNGRWGDRDDSCGDEWAMQNVAVPLRRLGDDGRALVPIRIRAGANVEEFWYRITLTFHATLADAPGPRSGAPASGPIRFGETEDHLHRIGAAEEEPLHKVTKSGGIVGRPRRGGRQRHILYTDGFIASCDPLILRHGTRAYRFFNIQLNRRSGRRLRISVSRFIRGADTDVSMVRIVRNHISGFEVRSKRVHRRRGVDEEFFVRFRISGRGSSGFLECLVVIYHLDQIPPQGDPPPRPPPQNPPRGLNVPGATAQTRLPSFSVRCFPDPLELNHGRKDSTLFLLRDFHPSRRPPPIAVSMSPPPNAQSTIFSLLSRRPDETRIRTPLSHYGVLVDAFKVHAIPNPIENFVFTLRFQRAGDALVTKTCRANVRHDERVVRGNRNCSRFPNSNSAVDCTVDFDQPSRGVGFRVPQGSINNWLAPQGTTCSQPEGPHSLHCLVDGGGTRPPGQGYQAALNVENADFSRGIEIIYVDEEGHAASVGTTPVN